MVVTKSITQRKKDHLKIALSSDAQVGDAGFSNYRFVHNALPEINFDEIDFSATFIGKKISRPFFISCMTGGVAEGLKLNINLAKAAEKYQIPMGVGSQRAAIEHTELRKLYDVRKHAPSALILANIGLVQLNYGYGLKEFEEAVKMVGADALVVHINPIQEVIQPEGDVNFNSLLSKFATIVKKISVPVIVKEVGFGLSYEVIAKLYNIGIRVFDTAGWGGTNWAFVEGRRREGFQDLGELFSGWGIRTTDSIREAVKFRNKAKDREMLVLGSGGVRTGLDIAKCLALGADLAGIAAPFAEAALKDREEVEKLIEKLSYELKVSMFGVGAKTVEELGHAKISLT